MSRSACRIFLYCLSAGVLMSWLPNASAQWTAPTQEELNMTSQPEVPGAAAVVLYHEETIDDQMHYWKTYVRLKVLTEKGKEYANVELRQRQETEYGLVRGYTVGDIEGRTIHSDGTIIPFTGKPYEKVVDKGAYHKEVSKVFTLPDVQVGSIIEYRFALRYDVDIFMPPAWFIQSELFTRKAHYLWRPTNEELATKGETGVQAVSRIAWSMVLPTGVQVSDTVLPSHDFHPGQEVLELNVQNIPPAPDEEHMPPIGSLSYRVEFYYSPYNSGEEFWKKEGKGWANSMDKFIGPNRKLKEAVSDVIAGADTQEAKLRKIYAAVMKLDNTAFGRERSAEEEKAEGLNPPKSTDDIWERKRGTDDQLTQLFVAMARAAGMKAYVMAVAPRDHDIFNLHYLSFMQLRDLVAIVNVDGKEAFFDPGQRYCPYGHMAWKHTEAGGMRQIEGGSSLVVTPDESYKSARTQRIADLTIDNQGMASGTVTMIWTGAPALRWRQVSLGGDATGLNRELRSEMEHLMPGGMEVKVASIEHLDEYEEPLTVNFSVKGPIGSATGKRLIIPGDLFEANAKPSFPHEKRTVPVYFEYASNMQDAVRITFPSSFSVESKPVDENIPFAQLASYDMDSKTTSNSITIYRNLARGFILSPVSEYADLRAFYGKFETKDQEPIVLKAGAPVVAGQ
ncbi:MAG TPA: DUF3857 domain-containing protein [Acidobacteriaceae bacterium]|nr:DUF3857 domain-containing protein [Acidobacteriaceae bacterium]